MNSTLLSTATTAAMPLDMVLLPAATAAPAALVIAVDTSVTQETTAWTRTAGVRTAVAAYAAVPAVPSFRAQNRSKATHAPPSRGTPV